MTNENDVAEAEKALVLEEMESFVADKTAYVGVSTTVAKWLTLLKGERDSFSQGELVLYAPEEKFYKIVGEGPAQNEWAIIPFEGGDAKFAHSTELQKAPL